MPKSITFETKLPSTPVYVNGDPGQLKQILMNLVINATEAIGEKKGSISILLAEVTMGSEDLIQYDRTTFSRLSEGQYVLLEVGDNGVGMSKEIIHKIFDPFFTTKFTGRGLGLSAVYGIVQGHKGGIIVESLEGAGTTFKVILPSISVPVDEVLTVAKQTDSKPKPTILVIDDEEEITTMARDMLESGKYTTVTELNPQRGIELYRQHQSEIGLVLLDLTMPEMSGKEVVDALQAINPGVQIIIMSGYSEEEVTNKLGTAKVSGFIQKPFRLQSLLKIVQSILH